MKHDDTNRPTGTAWKLPDAVVLLAALAGYAAVFSKPLAGLFGPPAITMEESYVRNPGGPSVDHSAFTALLADQAAWTTRDSSSGRTSWTRTCGRSPTRPSTLWAAMKSWHC